MTQTFLHACTTALLGLITGSAALGAQPPLRMVIQADRPGARISPTMYGVFFEDVNYGADGGLFGELVKNRSFEFPDPLMGWREIKNVAAGSLQVLDQNPFTAANPHYLKIASDAAGGGYGVANEGFFGIGAREGEPYLFSAIIRSGDARKTSLRIQLVNPAGRVLAQAKLADFTSRWTRYSATLLPTATEPRAQLQVILESPGQIDMDTVSLFPKNTWMNRPGGLRKDLVQWLADLKPGFVRFPGGCIVEGRHLATRYQWKNTIGKPEDRRLLINRWNIEFRHRPAPDYYQSFGLGFYEYFLLCEDIGAQPLPILNCGMACQFNSGELVPLDQLEPYIQDALDLIEFANAPPTTTWGQKRADMGHPQPFNLKFLGIGNEQWGPQYIERYERFAKAIKARHPDIQLIASAGPRPADDLFRFLWPKLRDLQADIIDEHCYDRPEWFFDNAHRYDAYDPAGPKVFMGEYAAQSVKTVSPDNRNDWRCALAEAAYITGLERNAAVVTLSSYAPLFGHEQGWQWRPNLIWFDNLASYGTPSYYVQQLFSLNRGEVVLPASIAGQPAPSSKQPGLYVCASRRNTPGEIIIKVVNSAAERLEATVQLEGVQQVAPRGTATTLSAAKLTDENSIAEPQKVAPLTVPLENLAREFRYAFAPYSVTVLRIQTQD
jgi:alpha-L-arabinofuranosidase